MRRNSKNCVALSGTSRCSAEKDAVAVCDDRRAFEDNSHNSEAVDNEVPHYHKDQLNKAWGCLALFYEVII